MLIVTIEEKNKALDTLTREVGGLRRSCSDVTDLEQSLSQANEALREHAHTVAAQQEQLQALAAKTAAAESTAAQAAAADDSWQQKYTAVSEKLQQVTTRLADAQLELGTLRVEREHHTTASATADVTSSALSGEVKALKASLAAQREEHLAEVSQLRQSLTERSARLDKLQAELLQVRANLESEHREQTELRRKVGSAVTNHTVTPIAILLYQ